MSSNDEIINPLRGDVTLKVSTDVGLTKSRNELIRSFFLTYHQSFAIITDDDVQYCELRFNDIHDLWCKSKFDVLTCKVQLPDGGDFSPYKREGFQHTSRTINSVSSIEIIISSHINENIGQVLFDEKFGLGSIYTMGEEAIFLSDILKRKGRIFFSPIYTFIHPKESTGSVVNDNWFFAKGAFYSRRYNRVLGACLLFRRMFKLCLKSRLNYIFFRGVYYSIKGFSHHSRLK
jgi:hypothetical protein